MIQSFCCNSLDAANELAEWLEHAVQVFCSSFRRADSRMKQQVDGPRVRDYTYYMTHGQRLWEHCQHYKTKDRALGHLEELLRPVMRSIEQEIRRPDLSEVQPNSNLQPTQQAINLFRSAYRCEQHLDCLKKYASDSKVRYNNGKKKVLLENVIARLNSNIQSLKAWSLAIAKQRQTPDEEFQTSIHSTFVKITSRVDDVKEILSHRLKSSVSSSAKSKCAYY